MKIEFSIYILYVLSAMISLFFLLSNNQYLGGELKFFVKTISDIDIVLVSLLNVLILSFGYFFYKFSCRKKFKFKDYRLEIKESKLDCFIIIILFVQIVFCYTTGVGVVGSNKTSPISFIFSILKLDTFFYVYYLYKRSVNDKFGKKLIVSIVLFSFLRLIQGWTGFILFLFFIEIYVRLNKNKNKNKNKKAVFIIPIFVILIGGGIYSQMYTFKNNIRGNKITETIGYVDGVKHLTSRLTMNYVSVGAYQNSDKIIKLYNANNPELKEVSAFFRPFVPSFLMDKNFAVLNYYIMNSYYPDLNRGTSSDFGLPMYVYILFKANFISFTFFMMLSLILFTISKFFFDLMSTVGVKFDLLYFFIIFKYIQTASLEIVFGYGFISNIFIFLALFSLGIFRFTKKI